MSRGALGDPPVLEWSTRFSSGGFLSTNESGVGPAATGIGGKGDERMRNIRLIDMGKVSALQSHTIYHALSHGTRLNQPDTILLSVPAERYVSLGLYQEFAKDTDPEYCRAHNIPVFRRQIGGRAHLLDSGQQVFQTVFHWQRAAVSATRMCQEILRVAVDTYNAFGVDAHYLPSNEINVRKSRISTGAIGRLGDAVVLACSLVYDSDTELERRALGMASHAATTSMARELGAPPDRDAVKQTLLSYFERDLKATLVPGSLNEQELAEVERLEKLFSSQEWIERVVRRRRSVREHDGGEEGARIAEGHHLTSEGIQIRATIRTVRGKVDDLVLSGDFLFYRDHFSELEASFRGAKAEWDALMTVAENFYLYHQVDSPGVSPADWVSAIDDALSNVR